MKKMTKTVIFAFLAAVMAGILIHSLYDWLPNPISALISPVRESLWEHLKLLFYPLLAVSLILTKGGGASARTPWLLSLVIVCVLLLGVSYLYHVTFRQENLKFDLVLYFVLMALGFLLPRVLWPLGERPWAERAAVFLVGLLGLLIVWFSFFPPVGVLFADLSGGVRTFLTIPV